MLSTQYRLRLEDICKSIAARQEVGIEDMIWAEKLSKRNTSARGMLQTARRLSRNEDEASFLKYLNIGDPDSSKHKRGFTDAGDIADWVRNDRPDDWRQRD